MFYLLKVLFPNGAQSCQDAVAGFLGELANTDAELSSHVNNLLMNFSKEHPVQFSQSVLCALLKSLEDQQQQQQQQQQ